MKHRARVYAISALGLILALAVVIFQVQPDDEGLISSVESDHALRLLFDSNGDLLADFEEIYVDRSGDGMIDRVSDGPWLWMKVDADGDGLTDDTDTAVYYLDIDGDSMIEHRVRLHDVDGDGDADYEVIYPSWDRDNHVWRYHRANGFAGRPSDIPQWHLDVDLDDDNDFNYDKIPFADSNAKDLYSRPAWGSSPDLNEYYTDPADNDGDGIHSHRMVWDLTDLRYGYETHRFYDLDGDDLTEMSIRFQSEFDGIVHAFRWNFDADNSNSPRRPRSWDFSFSGWSDEGFDQNDFGPEIPFEESPSWILNRDWDAISMTIQGTGRSGRWEGLFGFFIYVKRNWNKIATMQRNVRMECDCDASGGLGVYYSPLDGRVHLFGAEQGVDSESGQWYYDTDGDGFIDLFRDGENGPVTLNDSVDDEAEILEIKDVLPGQYGFERFLIEEDEPPDDIEVGGSVSQDDHFVYLRASVKSSIPLSDHRIQFIANENVDYNILAEEEIADGVVEFEFRDRASIYQFIYPGKTGVFARIVNNAGRMVAEEEVGSVESLHPMPAFIEISNYKGISGKRGKDITLSYRDLLWFPELAIWSIQPGDKQLSLNLLLVDDASGVEYRIFSWDFSPGVSITRPEFKLRMTPEGDGAPRQVDEETIYIPQGRRYGVLFTITDGGKVISRQTPEGGRRKPVHIKVM